MKLQLLGESGSDRFDDNSSQLTQNWHPHTAKGGKSQLALYPTPGLTLFADIGTGPIRGEINYNGIYFVVSGDTLYEIDAAGNAVSRGTLNTSSGVCKLDHNGAFNGKQICIVDGTDLYIWDADGVDFKVITDSGDPDYDADCPAGATHVEFFDGYFLINDPSSSGRFFKSSGYDGTAWDSLEFATAERSPDELQGLIKTDKLLWLVGKETAEPWFNSGAADFPFEPVPSGFSEWGTIAPYSLVEAAGLAFWISQNEEGSGMIIMANGLQPMIISTPEIAAELAEISDISDCYAYTYQKYQHTFIVFTFPSGQKTIVYDTTEKKFHAWKSKTLGYHRSTGHTFIYNKHLVGDPVNGRIYYLDWDNNTDNDDLIERRRITATFHNDDKGLDWEVLELDIKEGVGTTEYPDPQIHLRWRDDNGAWSNWHSRSMGKIGERNKKVRWRQLGYSETRVYEIMVSDPVKAVLLDGYARIKVDQSSMR